MAEFSKSSSDQARPAETWRRKKLIETGWDQPDTARLRQNIVEMNQTPFDGVVVFCNGKTDEGNGIGMLDAFSHTSWKVKWFSNCIEDLKAIKATKPNNLNDNFIAIRADPGVDWFDDAGWKNVIEHWRIAARIAYQGGLKGILFDPEFYPEIYLKGLPQFTYASQAQRDQLSFAEYYHMARERGKEVMKAIKAEYSNMTLFCYFMNSFNIPSSGQPSAINALAGAKYGLYPPFIDGWLDKAPPGMTIVDGCEISYPYTTRRQFLEAALRIKGDCQSLVSNENRAKYRAQVQVSFGIYLDPYVNPEGSRWYIGPKCGSRVNQLQANVTDALSAADEYVWIYGEQYRWWSTPGDVKPEWEQVIPGVNAALRFAADPAGFSRQSFVAGNVENLARNPNFKKGCAPTGLPLDWGFWQAPITGMAAWDKEIGHTEPGSAKASNVVDGCFLQDLQAQSCERYAVQAWARVCGRGNAWIRIRWQTPEGKWIHEESDKLVYCSGMRNQWQELLVVAEVPENVGKLLILLCMGGQRSVNDIVWFDDVTCLKLP
jgi:hypothetical protein